MRNKVSLFVTCSVIFLVVLFTPNCGPSKEEMEKREAEKEDSAKRGYKVQSVSSAIGSENPVFRVPGVTTVYAFKYEGVTYLINLDGGMVRHDK